MTKISRKITEGYLRKYGAELRKAREAVSLTQQTVAEVLNVPQSIISYIECGKYLPPEWLERAFAKLYGLR